MSGGRRAKSALIWIVAAVAVVVIGGGAFIYFVLFPSSSPKPFSLSGASSSTTGSVSQTSSTGTGTGKNTGTGTGTGTPTTATALVGAWKIAPGSLAGYRVREKLGFLPAPSDAVGRTSQITGGATIADQSGTATITAGSFTIAVNTLKSDQTMRDQHIQTIGLQSSTYPISTFVLSKPIALDASALSGQIVQSSATGVWKLHGTSRTVTIPLQLRISGTTMQAVGSIAFPWSFFNMTAPSVGGFVNVSDKATMEFDLKLAHA